MTSDHKLALIDDILLRASEQIGDISQPAITAFYQRFPYAREIFQQLAQNPSVLEAEMIEQVLYCLMFWFKRPVEIEILLAGSVPHHNETLNIPTDVYRGLLTATLDVIGNTIPPTSVDEMAVWQELSNQLHLLIDTSAQSVAPATGVSE